METRQPHLRRGDSDPVETKEWLDSIDAVVEGAGVERMGFLLERIIARAHLLGVPAMSGLNTPYVNTIDPRDEPPFPEIGRAHV